MDNRNLTQEEIDILQSFELITEINNSEISLEILENCKWDLEKAISSIYEGNSQLQTSPSRNPVNDSTDINYPYDLSQRSEILNTNTSPIISSILTLIVLPLSILYKAISKTIYFFTRMFPFLSKFMGFSSPNLVTGQFQKFNSKNTSEKFIRKFEQEHGVDHVPFFEGGYVEALEAAKKDLMFFMVILQSDLHDDTYSFNRITLTNENLIGFIANNNILVWAGSVHEPEAFQVSNNLNCTRFPFIAIDISHLHSSNTSIASSLARIEGFIFPNDMIATLETYVVQHLPTIQRLRSTREEQLIARQIRTQQDNAYEASLAIDRERMLQRKEEENHRMEIEKRKQKELNDARILEANKSQWRIWRASKLFPEPTSDSSHIAKVSLRLQNGERIVRKFDANASIEEIYAFIECYDINTKELHEPIEKPLNYVHKFSFQLVSPMPRQIIRYDTKQKILEEKNLYPSGNIIVENLDEDKND
ncbi:hypothetical protein MERGE_002556 [Pneumocystis wakefieldiae]|uniref:UBX domain-containing protein n=1 Tax=Pneumocystis wakefieldiae TaxID=38082 RepID=A0A899G9J2_9ASCO|nr:hypothetical protein MERGE_002556 [Pneumocystis wakefieldiae]